MHEDPTVLLKKQLIWLVLATIAGGIAMMVNLEALREYAYWLAAGSVLYARAYSWNRSRGQWGASLDGLWLHAPTSF